jgi:hypothetical protein
MVFCEYCNKEYKGDKLKKSHLNTKKHKRNYNKKCGITFKELNDNLNEYNLIKIIINNLGSPLKDYKRYEKIYGKDFLKDQDFYFSECNNITDEFLDKYIDEINWCDIVLVGYGQYLYSSSWFKKNKRYYDKLKEKYEVDECTICEDIIFTDNLCLTTDGYSYICEDCDYYNEYCIICGDIKEKNEMCETCDD